MMETKSPTFNFWLIVIKLELILFNFLRSIRRGNLHSYLLSTEKLISWCIAVDHHHYEMSLPIHLSDTKMLEKNKSDVH